MSSPTDDAPKYTKKLYHCSWCHSKAEMRKTPRRGMWYVTCLTGSPTTERYEDIEDAFDEWQEMSGGEDG